MVRGKTGQKPLSSWKQLNFERFVSIDLLGPEKMIMSVAQKMSKYLVDPICLFHDIFFFDKTKKLVQNFSFT